MNDQKITPQVLRVAGVAKRFQIGISTVWMWSKTRPDFPKPRKLGGRVTVWDVSELDQFFAAAGSGK